MLMSRVFAHLDRFFFFFFFFFFPSFQDFGEDTVRLGFERGPHSQILLFLRMSVKS